MDGLLRVDDVPTSRTIGVYLDSVLVVYLIIGCADGRAELQAGQTPRTDPSASGGGYARVIGSNRIELPYLRTCAITKVNVVVNVRNEKHL